jgi:hypothetical protein
MSALAAGGRDQALERRLDRLERAMAALRRIDEAAALRTASASSPLSAALGAFGHDVAATRRELRRLRRPAPADLTDGRGV